MLPPVRPEPTCSVDLAVVLTVFALIFLAELPDKTALASLVLGTRYRPLYVFAGTAAAFTVHVVLAIAARKPAHADRPTASSKPSSAPCSCSAPSSMLRGRHEAEEEDLGVKEGTAPTFLRVSTTSFLVILVAEFGDLTQIVTANLAAKYHDPLSVGLGAVLGLWAVAGPGHRRRTQPAAGRADHRDHQDRRRDHARARRDQHRRRDPRLSESARRFRKR